MTDEVADLVISADSHLDLGWLPADAFTSRMDPAWGDRIPHVVRTPHGARWVSGNVELSGIGGVGASGRPYVPGRWKRADAMASTGLYDDGAARPGDPSLRCVDQDRDGVCAEVIYGLHSLAPRLDDPGLAAATFVAFNDYLVEFCSYAPERLVGLACLPVHDPIEAANELCRSVELGFRGVVMDIKNGVAPIYDDAWDPVWRAATECGVPVSFHLGGRARPGGSALGTMTAPEGMQLCEAALGMSMLQFVGAADYFGIVFGGALDRFPTLAIVLAESGIGWIPSFLERLDYEIDNEFHGLGIELKPSQYWRRQMFATFSKDEVGLSLIEQLGEDHVMFASDYPHPDGIWPDSRRSFEHDARDLAPNSREKIAWRNAAGLYGITTPVARAV